MNASLASRYIAAIEFASDAMMWRFACASGMPNVSATRLVSRAWRPTFSLAEDKRQRCTSSALVQLAAEPIGCAFVTRYYDCLLYVGRPRHLLVPASWNLGSHPPALLG